MALLADGGNPFEEASCWSMHAAGGPSARSGVNRSAVNLQLLVET
jgi:hypothetical protein